MLPFILLHQKARRRNVQGKFIRSSFAVTFAGDVSLIPARITFNMIGKFGISGAFSVVSLYTSEVFPTTLRFIISFQCSLLCCYNNYARVRLVCRAAFDGGSGGFDPPKEVADPPRKFCRTSLGGSTLTPLRTLPRFHFLAKPVYLCTTIRRLRLYRDRRDLI